MNQLEKKTFGAIKIVFSLNIIEKSLLFTSNIILARLLMPNDFGLIGICWLTISTLETFTQTGFDIALIQKKEKIENYLDTVWIIQCIRGIVLYILIYLCSPLIENFFKSNGAVEILRALGLSLIIRSLSNIGMLTYIKEIDFKKQFIYNLSGTIVNTVLSITLAIYLRNVWAFVWGQLIGDTIKTFASYLLHSHRPRFSFNLNKLKELLGFSKWVTTSSIIIFLLTNGDDAFVGRYLGLAALGLYQMAYKISNLPATEITHVISQVALPLYSKFQNDTNELQKLFLKTFEILVLIVFPFSIMIFVYAEDFTKIFFGDKWLEMAPAIQILVIFGLTRSLGASMGPLLYSKGIPRVQAKLSFYQLLMMIVLIYPLSKKWGILGASLAIVIPNLLIFVIITITIKRLIQLRYVDFLKNTFISLTSSAILIFILFIGNFIHFNNIAFKIIILAGISILCYSVSVFILIQKRTQKSKINYV